MVNYRNNMTNENAGKTSSKVGGENFKRLSHAVNVF